MISVSMNSYTEGYNNGYNTGFNDGKSQKDANDTFDNSMYDEEFGTGYRDGYEEGFEDGYDDYINSLNNVKNAKRKPDNQDNHDNQTKKKPKQPIPKLRIVSIGKPPSNNNNNGFMDFFKILGGIAPVPAPAPPPPQSSPSEDMSKYEYKHVGVCNNLNDLITIGETVKASPNKYRYNIDTNKLVNALDAIKDFNNMIGLKEIKKTIFTKLMYHFHGLHDPSVSKETNNIFLGGVPGVGKSELIKHIANMYSKIGAVTTGQIVTVKIYDLISEHIGGTAVQTREILKKATGGILVIDEAYSIGNSEGKNTFNEEAITLIMAWLTEAAATSMCIIAGYQDDVETRLFSINKGLKSRFSTTLIIPGYDAGELREIFLKLVKDGKWVIENININFFETNMQHFPAFGRDMENLFRTSKEAHSQRLTTIVNETELLKTKKKLSLTDLQVGLTYKIANEHINNTTNTSYLTMYT